MKNWHEQWLEERDEKLQKHRQQQLFVDDLIGKTIVSAAIFEGKLRLVFSDTTMCAFEGEGDYDKLTEDLICEVVRSVPDLK